MGEEVSVGRFAAAVLDSTNRWLTRSTDGLSAEHWFYQPSPEANSIAWLTWHLSRWKDRVGALIVAEPQLWVGEGWAGRFGMDVERTGMGDTPDQVSSFRPEPSLLLGYAEAVHQATMRRIGSLSTESLNASIEYVNGTPRPAWQALTSMVNDAAQHVGQIAYLRGVVSGRGWIPY